MEFSTDINDKKIDLCFYVDGHKVSDFHLDIDEARSLVIKLQQAIVYLNYEIAKGVKPYGKAPLIKSIEYTDEGVVVHCKQRD